MPGTGLMGVYAAKYNYNTQTNKIEYSEGVSIGEAVSMDASITTSDAAKFYSNDSVSEEAPQAFKDGALTLGTNHLSDEMSVYVVSSKLVSEEINGTTVDYYEEEAEGEYPELGIGAIATGQIYNKKQFKAIVFRRVKFVVPNDSYTTRGESISWQTPSLTGTILRAGNGRWRAFKTFDSYTEAEAFLRLILRVDASEEIVNRVY